jgi:hypothetical protein
LSRIRRALLIGASGAFIIGALPGLVAAGNGVGKALNLGVNNTVGAITKLVATTSSAALLVQNSGTGPGLQITVGAGKAPITVSAGAGKATNLNADMLDGVDSTGFEGRIAHLSDLQSIACALNGRPGLLLVPTFGPTPLVCVVSETEPNDTIGTAVPYFPLTSFQGIAGKGDVDFWQPLASAICSAGHCSYKSQVCASGIKVDVYRNGILIISGVTSFDDEFDYVNATPVYAIKVYASPSTSLTIPYLVGCSAGG